MLTVQNEEVKKQGVSFYFYDASTLFGPIVAVGEAAAYVVYIQKLYICTLISYHCILSMF